MTHDGNVTNGFLNRTAQSDSRPSLQTVLYIIQEVVHEEVAVVSRNRDETTVWSGLHLFDESFPLQGDRRDEELR